MHLPGAAVQLYLVGADVHLPGAAVQLYFVGVETSQV